MEIKNHLPADFGERLRPTLTAQFKKIKENGVFDHFKDAAGYYKLPLEVAIAIGSRETNLENILGDRGNGHGIMQIDKRYFPHWCESGAWRDVRQSIMKGCAVLGQKVRAIETLQGRHLHLMKVGEFIAPSGLTKDEIMRLAIASYNAGEAWALYGATEGDPDLHTTGADYSEDVMARAAIFRELIGA